METYFIDVLKNHYADFSGRATRKQFWLFTLIDIVVAIVLMIVCSMFLSERITDIISSIYNLALFLPALSISARRLRDGGFSPWLLLLSLIPIIGLIALIILFIEPSK